FCQSGDGIRDFHVTGVQTCALPIFPLFSGKTIAGATVTFPATISYGAGLSYHADHWFGELYDYTRTRWVPYGPHRFDIDAEMQRSEERRVGKVYRSCWQEDEHKLKK